MCQRYGIMEDQIRSKVQEMMGWDGMYAVWYDETAKYTKGLTEFICPASFSKALTNRLKEAALNAFNALGCKGVARVDAVVNPTTETFVLLEVNTIPGMTDVSDLP